MAAENRRFCSDADINQEQLLQSAKIRLISVSQCLLLLILIFPTHNRATAKLPSGPMDNLPSGCD